MAGTHGRWAVRGGQRDRSGGERPLAVDGPHPPRAGDLDADLGVVRALDGDDDDVQLFGRQHRVDAAVAARHAKLIAVALECGFRDVADRDELNVVERAAPWARATPPVPIIPRRKGRDASVAGTIAMVTSTVPASHGAVS
jgi:hypothetical protein